MPPPADSAKKRGTTNAVKLDETDACAPCASSTGASSPAERGRTLARTCSVLDVVAEALERRLARGHERRSRRASEGPYTQRSSDRSHPQRHRRRQQHEADPPLPQLRHGGALQRQPRGNPCLGLRILVVALPQSARKNLDWGLENGIWGFPVPRFEATETRRVRDYKALRRGDRVILL